MCYHPIFLTLRNSPLIVNQSFWRYDYCFHKFSSRACNLHQPDFRKRPSLSAYLERIIQDY